MLERLTLYVQHYKTLSQFYDIMKFAQWAWDICPTSYMVLYTFRKINLRQVLCTHYMYIFTIYYYYMYKNVYVYILSIFPATYVYIYIYILRAISLFDSFAHKIKP